MVIAGVLIEKGTEKLLKKEGVRDSKLLTPAQRERLRKVVEGSAVEIHSMSVSPRAIDARKVSLNELEAQVIAELLMRFKLRPDHVYIDVPDPSGQMFVNRIERYRKIGCKVTAEHKADMKYLAVGAASIIAKTQRDESIAELEKQYGPIGSGYPSDPRTMAFLEKNVHLPIVRKSWSTAQAVLERKKGDQKNITEFF